MLGTVRVTALIIFGNRIRDHRKRWFDLEAKGEETVTSIPVIDDSQEITAERMQMIGTYQTTGGK